MDTLPDLFPLINLQIGHIKSSLSQAFLYIVPANHMFLILIDNQSWRLNKHSRSTHIWELMVTKYRKSPFRNTKTLLRSRSLEYKRHSKSSNKNLNKWFSVIDTTRWREKRPFSFLDLSKILYGFIVFEVAWKDVCGINYLNELQTDTSIAIETKSMRKWEFYSINEALRCTPSWFSGTPSETQRLQSNLVLLRNKIPSHSPRGITVASKEQLFEDTSPAQRLPEEIFFDARECSFDMQDNRTMEVEELINGKKEQNTEDEINIASLGFKDTLLLLWFNDRDLPIILRQVITSNSRLLALLELGLPTWVIFLQSYPIFCKVYHPWMRPLGRILYVLISLITMIIGFYDLYKNVPLLKATASHLFGPIFKWIEKSEMITRIFYLGTMLFVQNFGKALEWVLMMMRVIKTPVSIIMTPFMDPLEGMVEVISSIWNILAETGEQFFYTAQLMAESLCSMVVDLTQVLISPFELLYSLVSTLVTLVCTILYSVWKLLLIPARANLGFAKYVASLFSGISDFLKRTSMVSTSSMDQLQYFAQEKPTSSQISFWRPLWFSGPSEAL
ncbi:uncharacterized protein LOC117917960 isoform X1 [Vitis riparia]|uniref:uncharacterized protein LOC117917960 isoform X1 n=1 Tax=Vitis riparia TaxID=96939 RepID=UPI00155B04E4|nr:uncharacterized protein LOC117917960 isoform X1 [Vitis riparia]